METFNLLTVPDTAEISIDVPSPAVKLLFVVIILCVEVAVSQTKELVSLPPASVKLIVTEVPAQTLH